MTDAIQCDLKTDRQRGRGREREREREREKKISVKNVIKKIPHIRPSFFGRQMITLIVLVGRC